ncbi:MAG: lactoylglutathione lyase [Acidimicrobiales bacterium]
MRFAATGIVVKDLDRAVTFYTEVIGMKQLQRVEVPDLQLREAILNFDGRGAALVLMEYAEGADPGDYGSPGAPGGKIVVSSEDPVALVEAVRAAGGSVVREPRNSGFGLVGFVKDPDGTTIEILGH